jgi:hypothetical protein
VRRRGADRSCEPLGRKLVNKIHDDLRTHASRART